MEKKVRFATQGVIYTYRIEEDKPIKYKTSYKIYDKIIKIKDKIDLYLYLKL